MEHLCQHGSGADMLAWQFAYVDTHTMACPKSGKQQLLAHWAFGKRSIPHQQVTNCKRRQTTTENGGGLGILHQSMGVAKMTRRSALADCAVALQERRVAATPSWTSCGVLMQ
ncbi:unnamed protein product [Symbiodinium natans]|uniref:Uncharacterized protein n=1 Tax=Symbiodinium natans TaxID=878477 RepID=A0A812KFN4_9DINO|nr:unnamed protein product [Symbiodinium natans]